MFVCEQHIIQMQLWRNWHTRTFEGRVREGTGSSPVDCTKKKALASASAFFNEAHLRCMKNEAGLRPMKRAFGTPKS